jgi:hypothetical protein
MKNLIPLIIVLTFFYFFTANAQEKSDDILNNPADNTLIRQKDLNTNYVNPPFFTEPDAASNYTFSYSSGTYTAISGTISTATGDDGTQLYTLPFTFVYDGVNYTQITISTNGAIGMGTLNPSYSNNLASTTVRPVLAPLWDDLYDDATSNIQYTTLGSSPNRTFVIQWTGILWYYSGGTRQNFQIRLYETTNVIQFIYGAMLPPAGSPSASIGISDAVGGSSHFISVTPGSPPTYSTTAANNSINSVTYLTSGTTYTFTPPPGYCSAGASVQDEYISNVTVGSINNTTGWSSGGYGNYTALSTNMTIGVSYPISVTIGTYYSGDIVGVWVDWNKDYDFTDAGESFTMSAANPSTGTIIPPVSALTGNTRMRVRMQYGGTLNPCGTTTYGEVEDYTVNVQSASNMAYVSSTTTQTVTTPVYRNTTNNQIIGIEIVTTGTLNPFNATSFTLNTTGCTNPATDIQNAKVWYTGTSSVFATTTQFGSTFASPNGSFTINGNQQLATGTNYFWLTYDIRSTATIGNVVDAQCTQIVMSGAGGTRIPSPTSPAGSRTIANALSGTVNVGSGQTYTSLTGAGGLFQAINSAALGGNLIANITSNITEDGTYALNQWTESGSGGYTLTIKPSSASEKVLQGSVANSMIRFNGCDRVTIDGNGGFDAGTKYLRFRNTNGSNPTFLFQNDAKRNTITNCYIESNNTTIYTSGATIVFGTTTGTDGNDSNTISDNDIRDRSDAAGTPRCAITSLGTTTTLATYNSNNTISGNNIYNVYDAANTHVYMYLTEGTHQWNITGNSFYQTSARTTLSSSASPFGLILATLNGYGFNFSNNYFGGMAPMCGGAPMTYTSGGGLFAFRFFTTGTTSATSIQGNVVKNIDFTFNNTGSGPFIFRGLDCISSSRGYVNVGNITPNIIGGTSASDSSGQIILRINIAVAGTGTPSAINMGIGGSTGYPLGTVQNNVIGSIVFKGTGTGLINFWALALNSTINSAFTCSGNTVGNSVANNMRNESSSLTLGIIGIYSGVASPSAGVTLNNNTVQNFYNGSTNSSSTLYGIYHLGTATTTISNNIVRNFTSYSTNITNVALSGIISTSSAASQTVSLNQVYNLSLNAAGAYNNVISGIGCAGSTSTGTITRNKIYNLINTSTGSSPSLFGIDALGGNWTASNNMITLTNGEPSDNPGFTELNKNENFLKNQVNENNINNRSGELTGNYIPVAQNTNQDNLSHAEINSVTEPVQADYKTNFNITTAINNYEGDATNGVRIAGIYDRAGTSMTWNYYYNSVYTGGSQTSGSTNSYSYLRIGATTVLFRNNLFFNARTGGSGSHYAIGNTNSTPATGWSSTASNYNVFVSSNSNTIGEWGSGVSRTIDLWRTSSGGDRQTWSTTSSVINASNLFNSISTGNLNINSSNTEAWLVAGKGIAVSGQNIDYDGNTRATTIGGGCTDIGADEFGTPSVIPPLATQSGPPAPGTTTSYTLWGRTLCQIMWGPNGTFPSSMNVRYYSGVNNPNVVSGNYQNGYWNVSIGSGSMSSNAKYNIIFNFGDNETYTITTPSSNTILAKYESWSAWEVFARYISGSTNWKSQLNWAQLTLRVDSLQTFSDFALTDATAALPVIISEFKAAAEKNNVTLEWTTVMELNNKGFHIERKSSIGDNNIWTETGWVNGSGTSNSPAKYKYTDRKLNTGKYKYRIVQEDYNGNKEIFELPYEVIIGKPVVSDLSQNYPNPSNPKSKIDFAVPFNGMVTIKIFDITGSEVTSLVNSQLEAGYYTAEFDGTNLASGTYFYRIIAEGEGQKFVKTLKMILIK